MSETLPCLLRIGDNVKKNKLIKLNRRQITIGRFSDVDYPILSTVISRCHAIIKQQDDKWTVTDNKSLNGVYVNGRRLDPNDPYILQEGDMVQFGVSTAPEVPPEYVFQFHSALKVRREGNKRMRDEVHSEEEQNTDCDQPKKKKTLNVSSRTKTEEVGDVLVPSAKEADYEDRLAQMEQLLKEKDRKQWKVEEQLEKERAEREKRVNELKMLRLKEQAILLEMRDKEAELEQEKKRQRQMELELKEKERLLIRQLMQQKETLAVEKQHVEENLQAEIARAIAKKSKEEEERLISLKQDLEEVIKQKDEDKKHLEMRLNEEKEEGVRIVAMKAKEEVLSNVADLMELELQCTICSELFVKATALTCAHVFCKLCIDQWMMVKKDCPNCRTPIGSYIQAIALDSYIDKMVEQFPTDLQEKRKALLNERRTLHDTTEAGPSGSSPRNRSGRRSRQTTPDTEDERVTSTNTAAGNSRPRRRRASTPEAEEDEEDDDDDDRANFRHVQHRNRRYRRRNRRHQR